MPLKIDLLVANEFIKEKVRNEVEKPSDVMKGSLIDKFETSKER